MSGVDHEPRPRHHVGRAASTAVLRGLLLVLVAVAIGLLLLDGTDELAAEDQPVDAEPVALPPVEEEQPVGLADGGAGAGAAGDDGAGEGATDEVDEHDAEGDETTSTTSTSTTSSTTTTSTTAPEGHRDPGNVTVLVANGSGLAGAAASATEALDAVGYDTAPPSNVRASARVNASVVYYSEGFEDDAAAVAASFEPPPPVAPMTDPPPTEDLRGASVVLVLGPDLANP